MDALKLCSTDHGGVMIPAIGMFSRKWLCQTCIDRKRSHDALSAERNRNLAKLRRRMAIEPPNPAKAPEFRPYVVPQSQRDAEAKALAYSWRVLPSYKP